MAGRRLLAVVLALACPTVAHPQFLLAPDERRPITLQNEPLPLPWRAPAGLRADVRFLGARAFKPKQLRAAIARQLSLISERGLKETRASDAAFFLELFYRRQGYPDAFVGYEIVNGGRTLVLRISEGPMTILSSVRFRGNVRIGNRFLYKYLVGATRARFSRFRTRLPYVAEDIEIGIARLNRFYLSQGFLNAQVEPALVRFSAAKTRADITVPIREGAQYFFGTIDFRGETVFSTVELLGVVAKDRALPYSSARLEAMRADLEYFYKTRGYFQAEVFSESSPENAPNARVPVTFSIRPGGFYRFDGVTAEGLQSLPGDFLQKRLAHLQGKPYSPEPLNEITRELMGTGLFESFRFEQVALPNGTVRLDFHVKEALMRRIETYLGFGSYDGAMFGASFIDRNFFGTGRPLTLSSDVSQRAFSAEIVYEDPWLFDTRNRLRLRAYATGEEIDEYTIRQYGFGSELGRKLTRRLELTGVLEAKTASIAQSQIDDVFLGPRNYEFATIGFRQTYDSRKRSPLTSRGWVFNSALLFSTDGADLSFVRATTRVSYYLPIGKSLLAAGVRFGSIFGIHQEDLPIHERFFNGGSSTVRSFTERELGPADPGGKPIGGLSRSVFNLEYDFPIAGNLQGAVFTDAGSVSTRPAAFFDHLQFAVGAGLRYQLPIGPLRFDYGWNPSPRHGESRGAAHLSFGFPF